ncbi:thioester-containing protein 1 allele R1 isoform X1 [Leptinotarsa decemlineata]|uniref:thioester-containing protein 1 allele R1 isoform X1 n=1 Tax=Leptinotarsa decemlineata TaxID=7539 RepID=UPI003D30CA56
MDLLALIFLLFITNVSCQGYYNVVGPRVIRPNSEYHCAVGVQGTSQPTSVTVVLRGTAFQGTPFLAQDQLVVQPYGSGICRLEIGDLEDGEYSLEVRGSGGLDFSTVFPMEFVHKSYSVFIQTDRQVYQPGSKIMFRAIVLNWRLQPAAEVRNELLHIHISDGSGNRVKEWRGVEVIKGVFTGDLKLSESPVLGNWNISVTIHGQTYNKTVEVAKYIYPKFFVDITTDKHVTFRNNIIRAQISTRSHLGRKIQGEATVTAYPTIYSGVIQPIFQNPIRKVQEIDGSITVEFDIEKDLGLNDEYERTVIVDVIVEEKPTGRRQNNSVEVHIHKYDYHMQLIKTADYFKPGLKYTAYVKITNHDGTPVKNMPGVTVRHGYSRVDEVYEETSHTLDDNGLIKLEYFTPTNVTNGTALRIEAEFKDLKERISPIPAAVSYSNTFLQASLESDRPIVNLDVEIAVNCTEPLRYINYVLMGRGDVLLTNSFKVENSKEFNFRFTATHAMAPVCHLIVYYVRTDGELVGDSLDIGIDGMLPNFVDIQVNTVESEPDLDVEFVVRAQQNSYIGLMAVDENVGLLREGYDLTMEDIAEELKRYDIARGTPYPQFTMSSKTQFSWHPGASNPHTAIYESGADLQTNAHVNRHKPTLEDIYLRPVFYGSSTVKPDRGFGLPIHSVTRPPLAGPYAFSRIPKPVWNMPKVYLTQDIAPTWLFNNFTSGYEGKTSLRRRIPNTLNTWSITGFSVHPLHGLGLITSPKTLKVSKSFAVSLELPYNVRRGEILAVPVLVKNNMGQDINVEVTLHNSEQKFEFAEVSNEVNATRKVELYRRKRLGVKKYSEASISFLITTVKIGSVEIKVTANSPKTQDVAFKNLLVTAEGETEYYTKTILVDLRTNPNFRSSINFTIPENAVTNSEKIEVSTVGSFLGPAMIHLENLIRLPAGCGEQNLVHFMPNLIILQYLRVTRQLTPTIENEALMNLESSYQQQLTYKRPDGSFSPFGWRDTNGSVWLTAYVALALKQAKPYIFVDESIIENALNWLVAVQGKNGSFYETGNVIHADLQSREGSSLALTAFVTMALLESDKHNDPLFTNSINKGLDYLARNIDEHQPVYALALCSYALQIAKHTSKQSAFNLLDAKSKTKNNMKWWAKDTPRNEAKNPWNSRPKSIDIETTSYALLTFIEMNLLDDATPVLEWLINQQNSLGGFASSQDTVVGLHAMYKLVTRLASPTNIQVEFEYGKEGRGKFSVNKNNVMILQSTEISKDSREVNVTAQGTGLAIFKVSYQYNVNVTGPWPMFTLDPQVDKNSNGHHLQISICTAFVSRNLTENPQSNMAVMEVTLPSGYTADTDALPSLEVSQNVQKVETSHGLTRIILYFNNITRIEYCPTISAFRTHKVAKQKPVPVVIYDYYDTSRRARVFYKSRSVTLCDICEEEDCGDICSTEAKARASQEGGVDARDGGGASGIKSVSIWIPLLILFAVYNR